MLRFDLPRISVKVFKNECCLCKCRSARCPLVEKLACYLTCLFHSEEETDYVGGKKPSLQQKVFQYTGNYDFLAYSSLFNNTSSIVNDTRYLMAVRDC